MNKDVADEWIDLLKLFIRDRVNEQTPGGSPLEKEKSIEGLIDGISKAIKSKEQQNIIDTTHREVEFLLKDAERERKTLIQEGEREKERLILEANQSIEKSKLIKAIKDAKRLIIEGIFGAFIIGILVNQITEMILPVKEAASGASKFPIWVFSIFIVISLIALLNVLFKIYFFTEVEEMIKKTEKGE